MSDPDLLKEAAEAADALARLCAALGEQIAGNHASLTADLLRAAAANRVQAPVQRLA